jgi:c-di-GMP-binding flagellar brake protein YcgR
MSGATDTPALETAALETDPYLLTARLEILRLFRSMQENGLLIQMQGRLETSSALTTLLKIDDQADVLILDAAPRDQVNQALVNDGKVKFEVWVDQVKVKFVGGPVQLVMFDGRPALSLPLPASVRRIQQRGSFRAQVPVVNPATCVVPLVSRNLTLTLHDISATGLAMLMPALEAELAVGTVLRDCTLDLPDIGRIQVDLQIKREVVRQHPSGKRVRQIGAAFVEPSGNGQRRVQNYISRLERQRLARKRGLA